ncbi:hypothetical protein ABW21_db0204252 [Orbilia brochopaga]|nr:hypothetical protein ABW21_db0204252 [Drechslerella brochopaga]
METASIWTYHCICSHLILATTRDVFRLPRRQEPGLDSAYIVPLPPPPRADSDTDSEYESEDEDDDAGERMEIDRRDQASSSTATGDSNQAGRAAGKQSRSEDVDEDDEDEPKDYTLLLSSIRDKKPCIIQRDDGFEKRLMWRCGRCRLIFGYQIYDETLEEESNNEEDGTKKKPKRRPPGKKYYVYILPGGLTTAADMGSLKEADLLLPKDD